VELRQEELDVLDGAEGGREDYVLGGQDGEVVGGF